MMDVTAWRREQRLRLYAARKAMTAEQRYDAARKISGGLDDHFAYHKPALVGLYWPIKYEPNLLSWARTQAQTFRFCLPVAVSRGQPLEYWLWVPGDRTQSGVWDIQIPAHREVVTPALIIAPLLGFDRARYRLAMVVAISTARSRCSGIGHS
jgi:5-formyltetrahydrofolate cyclo-ligase